VSGDSVGKLSSLANVDSEKTRTATRAAVPAILSALAGAASTKDGAKKLVSTLRDLDFDRLTNMIGADTGALVQQGNGLLKSLLGDNLSSSIASAIGRYSGMGADAVKKVLAALIPSIVGFVGSQWKSRGATPESLMGLFAEQKSHIARAIPDGFSLSSIPGLAGAESAARQAGETMRVAGDTARRGADKAMETSQSALRWLLPAVAAVVVLLALWWMFNNRPDADVVEAPVENDDARQTDTDDRTSDRRTALRPEVSAPGKATSLAEMTSGLKSIFSDAATALSSVKDADSANAALPKLRDINQQIDPIRNSLDQLPESGRVSIGKLVDEQMSTFKDQVAKTFEIPGVREKLQPVVDQIVSKLTSLTEPAAET
jgi:hypothetical protein